jgi:hypothetical protein
MTTNKKETWRFFRRESSRELFEAAWRKYLAFARNFGTSEQPDAISTVDGFISGLVNNPKSRFYIYG